MSSAIFISYLMSAYYDSAVITAEDILVGFNHSAGSVKWMALMYRNKGHKVTLAPILLNSRLSVEQAELSALKNEMQCFVKKKCVPYSEGIVSASWDLEIQQWAKTWAGLILPISKGYWMNIQ